MLSCGEVGRLQLALGVVFSVRPIVKWLSLTETLKHLNLHVTHVNIVWVGSMSGLIPLFLLFVAGFFEDGG